MEWLFLAIVAFYLLLGYGVASGINSVKTKMGWVEWIIIILIWPAVLIGLIAIRLMK